MMVSKLGTVIIITVCACAHAYARVIARCNTDRAVMDTFGVRGKRKTGGSPSSKVLGESTII
jgi:hypothetical protein